MQNNSIPLETTLNTAVTPPAVIFTKAAAAKVYSLIAEEGNFQLKLRVFVQGGGCSGFQYGFTFDSQVNEDDVVVETMIDPNAPSLSVDSKEANDEGESGSSGGGMVGVQLLIDALSFQYLNGAVIDYRADVSGEHFVINNPNAKTTCGCGSSFAA